MNTKEEMIEEIEEMEDISADSKDDMEPKTEEVKPDISIIEPVIEDAVIEPVMNDVIGVNGERPTSLEQTKEEEIVSDKKEETLPEETINENSKKNKAPLIVLLSILLVLDIAALVIYMIGIEKVVSFIR